MALDEVLEDIWNRLLEGVERRKCPYHLATLVTIGPDGPEARTVVLRGADRAAGTLCYHTDARSAKAREVGADNRVSLLFYDPVAKVQVRARATARLHTGDDLARAVWEGLTPLSRRTYSGSIGPGQASETMWSGLPPEVADEVPEDWAWEVGFDRLAVGVCTVWSLEWLRLGFKGHARARFELAGSEWVGGWVVP